MVPCGIVPPYATTLEVSWSQSSPWSLPSPSPWHSPCAEKAWYLSFLLVSGKLLLWWLSGVPHPWPPSRVSVPNTSLGHHPTYPLSISEGHTQSQNSIAEGRTKWMEMPVLVMEDQGSFWELSSELSILGKFCSLSTVCYNSNNRYHFLYPFICQTLF